MTRFPLVRTPDVDDGGYTVEAIGLPGLVTDGATVEEAMSRAREAIELYFEAETPDRLRDAGVRLDYLLTSVEVDVVTNLQSGQPVGATD